MISLKTSLSNLPELKSILSNTKSKMLSNLYENLDELKDITELIEKAIIDDPPITIKEGGIIKSGYNKELDEYKKASIEGKSWIVKLQELKI